MPRIELLLKLFFAGNAPPGVAREQLKRFRAVHEEQLAQYALVKTRLASAVEEHPQLRFWMATLAYGQRTSAAMLTVL